MSVIVDPEGVSAEIIQDFYDFSDRRVLEIGCGQGRITMAIAESSQHVTAIDPLEEDIQTAIKNTPPEIKDKINYLPIGIAEFDEPAVSSKFDIAIFTWSL